MRQRLLLSVLAACAAVGLTTTAGAEKGSRQSGGGSRPATYTIPGEQVFPEGIARQPGSKAFFVSSTTDGTIFRGDLRSPELSAFAPGGSDGRVTAIGLKADRRGRLVVAGGPTGKVFVLSTDDGSTLKVLDTGRSGMGVFLNDVAISDGYAYITDSMRPILYRVRLGRNFIGEIEEFVNFQGTAFEYQPGFNANGIAIDESGRYAIIVQSGTGKLFRVNLRSGRVVEVDLGGETVTNGDGLLLDGNVLYVTRNMQELIVPIRLFDRGRAGVVGEGVTGPQLKFPTTIALDGDRILAVNSQFDKRATMQPPELPFDVATIAVPDAPDLGRGHR